MTKITRGSLLLPVLLLLSDFGRSLAWITPTPPSSICDGCRGVGAAASFSGAGLFYLRTQHSQQESLVTLSATKKKKLKKAAGATKKKKKKKAKAATKKQVDAPPASTTSVRVAAKAIKEPAAVVTTPAAASSGSPAVVTATDLPYDYATPREFDQGLLGDLTGGRPGAIIETAEQLQLKDQILTELDSRGYDPQMMDDYGELAEMTEAEYDIDDPDAIDAATLGTWTIYDLESKFDYEWDPLSGAPDPNHAAIQKERTIAENPKDEDGIEIGFKSFFGPSNPIDTRTIVGSRDSYMVDEKSRDEAMLTPQFAPGDVEEEFNEDFVKFRKSLDIMETYVDQFLPDNILVPRHVAKWHGYPEQTNFRPQNYTNNRFTPIDKKTDFDALSPFRARQKAVEMARATNAEWMRPEVHVARHTQLREPYEKYQTLVGTLRKGDIDDEIVQQMEPALKILGSCVELLSTWQDEETGGIVLRFYYHGLMKNKHGMKAWTESLLQEECGMMNVNNVIFETGFRRRDPAYEGGDYYYGPYPVTQ